MHHSNPSTSSDPGDADILQILVRLSDIKPLEWAPEYPFLDTLTVSQVSHTISLLLSKGRPGLRNQLLPLLRKWCTGRNKADGLAHCTWIGRSMSVEQCVETAFSVCIPILKNEDDWIKRDSEQQLAVCHAVLCAATNSPTPLHERAGDICALLLSRVLSLKHLGPLHHRFLAQLWNSIGELPITLESLILMVQRSFLGIERMMLWMGKEAMARNSETTAESFMTLTGSTLLRLCSHSPYVFQNVCNLLVHMMVVSESHPGIQRLTKSFISGVEEECRKNSTDICALYEESCQVLSALMCVDPSLLPEHGENVLSRQTILNMLSELPKQKAACLLSHRPNWLICTI